MEKARWKDSGSFRFANLQLVSKASQFEWTFFPGFSRLFTLEQIQQDFERERDGKSKKFTNWMIIHINVQ